MGWCEDSPVLGSVEMSSFDYNPHPDYDWDSFDYTFSPQDFENALSHLASSHPGPNSTEAEQCENALYRALGMGYIQQLPVQ